MVKTFHYKALRDIISTCIGSFFTLICFLIMNAIFNSGLLDEVADAQVGMLLLKWLYIFGAITIITICILSIYTNTFSCLIIKPNEILYQTGWLSKKTTSIPSNKIRSCSKSSGILQRACGTMSISITTAGDSAEIHFNNLENGEAAYQLICQLSRQNERGYC